MFRKPVSLMILAIACLMPAAAHVPADAADALKQSAEYQQSAELVVVNSTSVWISVFVDDVRTCSIPPGDQGVDFVSVGYHNFRAETLDGTQRFASRYDYLGENGATWTITEE